MTVYFVRLDIAAGVVIALRNVITSEAVKKAVILANDTQKVSTPRRLQNFSKTAKFFILPSFVFNNNWLLFNKDC